jgi:hypothetical protein
MKEWMTFYVSCRVKASEPYNRSSSHGQVYAVELDSDLSFE